MQDHHDVDELRAQLRERGYLSHGIERWFARDPWSSRTFWLELAAVALKAAVLIGVFGMLVALSVMVIRNASLGALEIAVLLATYGLSGVVFAFGFIVFLALLLRFRAGWIVDAPRVLFALSLSAAGVLVLAIVLWWRGFDGSPELLELLIGGSLAALFLLVATTTISAALLSLSIYAIHRVPAVHQRPRGRAMAIAAAVLVALLFLPALASSVEAPVGPPSQVVVTPTSRRLALVAVDGLTGDIASSRPILTAAFATIAPLQTVPADSTAERWASVGTGVPPAIHRVHAIEGLRLRGGGQILQAVSSRDFILRHLLPALRLGERQPLPPAARRREYAWEIFAGRGVRSVAVNWWTSGASEQSALTIVGQEAILAGARGEPLRVDTLAAARLFEAIEKGQPRLAVVYLPALDIILNRVGGNESSQVAQTIQALDHLAATVAGLRTRGYEVVLVGLPGDRQRGIGVIGSTNRLATPAVSAFDIAPTLCDLFGFPASKEMPGKSLAGSPQAPRIATYGSRVDEASSRTVDREYYDNLKSLGYIR